MVLSVNNILKQRFRFLSFFTRHEKMKVLLVDNLILKLILPTFRSRPEEDWSIQLKRRQDKFQDKVICKKKLHLFMSKVEIPGDPSE